MKKYFLVISFLLLAGIGCKQNSTNPAPYIPSSSSVSVESLPAEKNDGTILYTDNKNGVQVKTTSDCVNVFSVKSDNSGSFSIHLPHAKNWQGGWYGYQLMTEDQYQETVKDSSSQGVIKMAKLNNGLFLVAFQPQDSPQDSDLIGTFSGKVCPLPAVIFNNNQSVQGFLPTTK